MTDTLGVALLAVFLSVILGGAGFRGARLITVVGTVLLYLAALTMTEEIVEMLLPLASSEGAAEAVRTVLKIVGVAYGASVTSDICRDMGEVGVANAVLTVGRVEILLIATPSVVGIAELAIGLMGG